MSTGSRSVAFVALILAACAISACTNPVPTIGPAPTVSGIVTAGPTCPVVQSPEPSGCAPRPLSGAVLILSDPDGTEITRATTGVDGSYIFSVGLSEGPVIVSALPVAGLTPPAPVMVDVVAGPGAIQVNLEYDTGIR
jgi:hypothetical protein